jgi:hypothetical protein
VPGVDFAHAVRVGRQVRTQGGADLTHEGQGRLRWRPDSQQQGRFGVGIAEAMPVPAGCGEHGACRRFLRLTVTGHQQSSAQYIDPFIELVMGVRDRPSEIRRDNNFHRREPRRLAVLARQDVQLLAGVGEASPSPWRISMVMPPFLPRELPEPRGNLTRRAVRTHLPLVARVFLGVSRRVGKDPPRQWRAGLA